LRAQGQRFDKYSFIVLIALQESTNCNAQSKFHNKMLAIYAMVSKNMTKWDFFFVFLMGSVVVMSGRFKIMDFQVDGHFENFERMFWKWFDSCATTLMPRQQKELYSKITIYGSKRDHIWYQACRMTIFGKKRCAHLASSELHNIWRLQFL